MYASIHSAFSMLPLQSFVSPRLVGKLDSLVKQLLANASSPAQHKLWGIQHRWLSDHNRGQLE
jgi:hypothetical protein